MHQCEIDAFAQLGGHLGLAAAFGHPRGRVIRGPLAPRYGKLLRLVHEAEGHLDHWL
jgi:hypothetical protein